MTALATRLVCCRCFVLLLCAVVTLVDGKMSEVEKSLMKEKALEASSQTWKQFHGSPDAESYQLTTLPADASSRQPDLPLFDGKSSVDGVGKLIRKTRQVDPLHSCIEAKCSSWKSTEYLNCIYHHCINGFESSSSRFGRNVARKMHRLMMREGSQVENLVSGKLRRSSRAARIVSSKMRHGSDEESTVPEKMKLGSQMERNVPEKLRLGSQVPGKMQQVSQAEQVVPWKTQLGSDAELIAPGNTQRLLLQGNEAEPPVPVVASVPGALLSMVMPRPVPVRRRGFNDISDVCKERNCGPYQQSVEYFNCIENIVDCPSLRR